MSFANRILPSLPRRAARCAALALVGCLAVPAAQAQSQDQQIRLGEAGNRDGGRLEDSVVGWISRQAELIVSAEDDTNSIAGAFSTLYGAGDPAPPNRVSRRLALVSTATNLNAEPRSSVHSAYVEAVRGGPGAQSGRLGDAIALELQTANLATDNPMDAINPYENVLGRTYGLLLGSGGDVHATESPTAANADSAITVAANPMRWNQGIVFRHNALETQPSPLTGGNAAYALELAKDHQITWWDNTGGVHESVALTGRPGGDFETVVERNSETRVGGRHRTIAGGYAMDLSSSGLRVAGPQGSIMTVGADTLILDPAILPGSPDGLPVGGVWMQTDRDGQGTLRIRLR